MMIGPLGARRSPSVREDLFLLFPGRMVVVIVEADFAHGDHVGLGQQSCPVLRAPAASAELGLVGMDAGAREDAGTSRLAGVARG